ncbi:MAG TPA: DUF4197 domain-containing protein [Bacteroidales bacterium]|nr:DUF4197 domain-containing protein [Bacteroidales bacterium]
MRNLLVILLLISAPAVFTSCDQLLKTISTLPEQGTTAKPDIVKGLKTALMVGTDTSVAVTSKLNGYYKDEAIKILLPPEADIIYKNKDNALFRATGLDRKIEEAILSLNRAAEDAAGQAAPIFKEAIRNMSITDGLSIVKGKNPAAQAQSAGFDSTAATAYLKSTTWSQLRPAFAPKVNASLDKKLVGNYSPNQIWHSLTSAYNGIADKSFGMIKPVGHTDLGAYVTEKALDGLFYKVGREEIKIRRDPLAWTKTSVGHILEQVFGSHSGW